MDMLDLKRGASRRDFLETMGIGAAIAFALASLPARATVDAAKAFIDQKIGGKQPVMGKVTLTMPEHAGNRRKWCQRAADGGGGGQPDDRGEPCEVDPHRRQRQPLAGSRLVPPVARLNEPVLSKALTRFEIPWKWDGGEAFVQARAMDETGYVQPTLHDLRTVRGVNSIYHKNAVYTWHVLPNGEVQNVQIS